MVTSVTKYRACGYLYDTHADAYKAEVIERLNSLFATAPVTSVEGGTVKLVAYLFINREKVRTLFNDIDEKQLNDIDEKQLK